MDLNSIINQINEEVSKETDKIKPEIEYIKNEETVFNNEETVKKIEDSKRMIIAAKVEESEKRKNLVNETNVKTEDSKTSSWPNSKTSSTTTSTTSTTSSWWGQSKTTTTTPEQKAKEYSTDRIKKINSRVKSKESDAEEKRKHKKNNWDILELQERSKMSASKAHKKKRRSKAQGVIKDSMFKGVIYACKVILEELYLQTRD